MRGFGRVIVEEGKCIGWRWVLGIEERRRYLLCIWESVLLLLPYFSIVFLCRDQMTYRDIYPSSQAPQSVPLKTVESHGDLTQNFDRFLPTTHV